MVQVNVAQESPIRFQQERIFYSVKQMNLERREHADKKRRKGKKKVNFQFWTKYFKIGQILQWQILVVFSLKVKT